MLLLLDISSHLSIATSVTTVHHLLSHSVSGLLAIQTFQSPLAVDYLSSLIDQTLLSQDFPFKLGPRVFAFLREVFHYHDFSVANFLASLQVWEMLPICSVYSKTYSKTRPTAISRVLKEQYLIKYTNNSEMHLKTLLYIKTVKKTTKKAIKNKVITDRQTDRPT